VSLKEVLELGSFPETKKLVRHKSLWIAVKMKVRKKPELYNEIGTVSAASAASAAKVRKNPEQESLKSCAVVIFPTTTMFSETNVLCVRSSST
jgi:hypothetical protein